METNRDQDDRIISVVSAALQLEPAERARHVLLACGNDTRLYKEITEAMEWEQRMGSFLQDPMISFQEPARPFKPGQIVSERFEILREIGEGGMGIVYEAFDRKRNQRIAIKSAKPGFHRLLAPELEGALKVRHPNICLVNEIHTAHTEHGEVDFLTMEFLEGETLSARLSACGKFSARDAAEIACQLCKGLAEAHRSGVIHRDLKAANVILCRTANAGFRAVITDFGLSGESESGPLCGTPRYIAPELWLGEKASKASDVYGLGVILHEMVTGYPPSSDSAVEPRAEPGELPRSYSRLVEACLNLNPEKRYRAFLEAFPLLESDNRPLSRRKMLVTGIGALCAVAASAWVERDALEDRFHPLPRKRFVALLAWPPTADTRTQPMVSGVIDAIENELARAEASDRDLFVVSSRDVAVDSSGSAQIRKACDSLGANLVLAASAISDAGRFRLILTVLDALTSSVLRRRQVVFTMEEITALTGKAVRAAAGLLNVPWDQERDGRLKPPTDSVAAFRAFQMAEELKNRPNDEGLDAAIDTYLKAIDSDPGYASAYAKLAIAYSRLYAIRRDPGALELAQANAGKAIGIDPNSVDGRLALAYFFERKGNQQKALDEIDQALKLDPANPRTLLWKAQIYGRFRRWTEAEETFRRLEIERPNYWLAYQELGVLLSAQARYQEAIRAFQVAVVAAPRSALAVNNLGVLHLKLGKFGAAEENFRRSLTIKANDLAYCNLSEALRDEGKYADALRFGREAVKLNPSDDQNWLELADCYDALPGQEKQARQTYLRAASEVERRLQTDPADGCSWIRLALYRLKSGSGRDVASLLKKADEYGANDIDSEVARARVFELSGRRNEALGVLAACLKRGTTGFELASIRDFNILRKAPEYAQISKKN